MTPYLNYLLSEIRATPAWEYPNPSLFKHYRLILKIIDCGIESVGFGQTSELVQTLLTIEQREILEKYKAINSVSPEVTFALIYPPSFDWNFTRHRHPASSGVQISSESVPELVAHLFNSPDALLHLRASWLIHRSLPNTPNTDFYIQRTIQTLHKYGHPKRPDPLLKLQVYTLEEITPVLQKLEPIINQPPREIKS